jgi:hypothetical protein
VELRGHRGPGLRRPHRGGRRVVAIAVAIYAVAAVLAAVPGIEHIGSEFLAGGAPGYGEAAPGDHLQTSYHLWLFGDQVEHGRYPWRDPYSFRPEAKPTVNPAVWPYGIVFWPLYHLFGLVLGWNLFVLLTFVAAGLIAMAWLREVGLAWGPAIVGGLAFEIAPYRVVQSAGHLLGPISLLLPLSLWALERGRRGNPAWLVLSAIAIASIPLSGQVHLAIGAVPFYAAYAVARLPGVTVRRWLYLSGAGIGVALAIGAGLLIDRVVVQGSVSANGRSLSAVSAYSASWLDFFSRSQRHGSESFVFLGWLTPLLALLGLYVLVRIGRAWLGAVLGLGATVPMLLALGTNTPLYRPVHAVVPGLQYPRVPERLMPVACLAVAALVAFALQLFADDRILASGRVRLPGVAGRIAIVTAVAVVAIAADLHYEALKATAADSGNRAYKALDGGKRDSRLLEVPVFLPDTHYGSVYQYYDTVPRRERPGGYSTTAPVIADVTARLLQGINCGDWSSRPGLVLQKLGVREIAFHRGLFVLNPAVPGRSWFAWRGLVQHGYRRWAQDGAITMLDRLHGHGPAPKAPVEEPRRDTAQLCAGWYGNDGNGRAMSAGHAPLWAYSNGPASSISLVMRSYAPVPVTFSVDGRRLLTRRISALTEVRVPLGARGWHLVALDTPVLPMVDGRREGARLIAYVLD